MAEYDRERDPESGGFGHDHRRMRLELLIVVGCLLTVPVALLWVARSLAGFTAQRLPPSVDAQLAEPTWLSLQASGAACRNDAPRRYVESLAEPLTRALHSPFAFRYMVVDSDEINAFALPGGSVVVNMGLLQRAQSGDEVAAVLAHEMQHVVLRHGTERLLSLLGTFALLGAYFGAADLHGPTYTLSGLAALQYSRNQEHEADEGAVELLGSVNISPLGMSQFFARLASMPNPPEMLSTHPDPGRRAELASAAAAGIQAAPPLPLPADLSCD